MHGHAALTVVTVSGSDVASGKGSLWHRPSSHAAVKNKGAHSCALFLESTP